MGQPPTAAALGTQAKGLLNASRARTRHRHGRQGAAAAAAAAAGSAPHCAKVIDLIQSRSLQASSCGQCACSEDRVAPGCPLCCMPVCLPPATYLQSCLQPPASSHLPPSTASSHLPQPIFSHPPPATCYLPPAPAPSHPSPATASSHLPPSPLPPATCLQPPPATYLQPQPSSVFLLGPKGMATGGVGS